MVISQHLSAFLNKLLCLLVITNKLCNISVEPLTSVNDQQVIVEPCVLISPVNGVTSIYAMLKTLTVIGPVTAVHGDVIYLLLDNDITKP